MERKAESVRSVITAAEKIMSSRKAELQKIYRETALSAAGEPQLPAAHAHKSSYSSNH